MQLRFSQTHNHNGTTRTVTVISDKGQPPMEIFFTLPGEALPMPQVLDGFVFGIIFYAMRLGEDIHVHGAVSASLLFNIREWQEAWILWRPEYYQKILVTADQVIAALPARPLRALAAFYGDVDSTFTALRHSKRLRQHDGYPLDDALVMVDGFHTSLNTTSLREQFTPLAQELSLTLKIIQTNIKDLALAAWEDSHSALMAACVHNFSHDYAYALFGNGMNYNAMTLPQGSNPITDQFLSGGAMRIVSDGSGETRTEKLAWIARHLTTAKTLLTDAAQGSAQ